MRKLPSYKTDSVHTNHSRNLGWFTLGISLVSLHFGLGFLIGSGEAIYNQGPKGILYGLSTSLGLFSLAFIASFYWKNRYPIWVLMGNKYGRVVKNIVAFLSMIWMVGVVASQILGGAAALTIFGANKNASMLIITLLVFFLSITRIDKLTKILLYMLLFTAFILLYVLFSSGPPWLSTTLNSLSSIVGGVVTTDILGIVVPTVLVTFIGMDFHQFVVRTKTAKDAVKGNIFGGILLLIISFLVLGLVLTSLDTGMISHLSNPNQVIPIILFQFGRSLNTVAGTLFPFAIIFVAVGSGSGVERIISSTITSLSIAPKFLKRGTTTPLVTSLLALMIALTGESIISLIVSFYAIYVGSVFFPFLAYLIERKGLAKFKEKEIRTLLVGSTIVTFSVFLGSYFGGKKDANISATILLYGFLSSIVIIGILKVLNNNPAIYIFERLKKAKIVR